MALLSIHQIGTDNVHNQVGTTMEVICQIIGYYAVHTGCARNVQAVHGMYRLCTECTGCARNVLFDCDSQHPMLLVWKIWLLVS